MARIIIEGFNNIEDAQIFVDWYRSYGERDSEIWFEEATLQKITKRTSAYVEKVIRKPQEIIVKIK